MGNEMGNSNTSGLQDEENSTTQVEGKRLQEAGHINGAEVENHIVYVAEGKNYHENGLASDVPNGAADLHVTNQASHERKEEEIEVQPPAESPKVEVKSNNEASDERSEIQQNSVSNDSKDHEKPPANADGEGENHMVPVAEDRDYQGKETNGSSSVISKEAEDLHIVNQISDESDQEETEVHAPAESPKSEVESNSAGGDTSDIQPTSPSKHPKDHKTPQESKLEENLQQISDHQFEKQSSIKKDQEETEVHAPAESPKSEVESNSAGGDTSDIQPTSPSKHSKDHETPQESKLEENLQQISDHQFEKQSSIKKEEDGTKNSTSETISSSHDPEPQEFEVSKFDQPESANIHADPPIQDSNGSLNEDILGLYLNCTSEDNGHPIVPKILKDMDEIAVSGSNLEVEMKKDDFTVKEVTIEDEVYCEDRLEIKDGDEIGDDFSRKPMTKSDLVNGDRIICNGDIPTEIIAVNSDSPRAEPEVSSTDESPNPHLEVSESKDNYVVLAAETISKEKESQHAEDKPNDCPTQSCEESVQESKALSANLSQSEFLTIEPEAEDNQKRIEDFTCDGGNEDCIEAEKVAENGHLVDEHINDQIEASAEHSKDLQKEAEMVVVSEIVLTELSLSDCKREKVSDERQLIEEIEEKTKASYDIGNNTEGREKCLSPTLLVEQEVSLPRASLSLVQSQENQQNNEMQSKNIQSSNESISELKQENCGDVIATESPRFDSKNLMAETLVSVAELAIEKPGQDLSNHISKIMTAAVESDTQENHLNEECAKVEMPAFASDDYQTKESVGRFSTESNPNNSNTHSQIQKSPSFGPDLRIEARTEESDRIPLLYRDKTAIEDFSTEAEVSLGNPIARTQHDQNTHQAMPEPVEEKVVKMERSDSEKSKTPLLGFLKEEEEAHIIVTPQKHNNTAAKRANKESLNLLTKEVGSTSPKNKEKRKPRSSLFSNCMCCTTVIN